MKHVAKRMLGERVLGIIDYYRHPDWRSSWGGALNGQVYRQRMVEAFIRELPLDAIVETGTYRGTTTAFLASLTSLPIYTVENDLRRQGFSFSALRRFDNVRRYGGDSREFLRLLASMPELENQVVLFYLDAHGLLTDGAAELPLADEIDIIFRHWLRALVLIDDFQVPDDDGYAYDNYGPGKALTHEYLRPGIRKFGLRTFLPSATSDIETGRKRGCVTLAANADLISALRAIPDIREWTARSLRSIAGGIAFVILQLLPGMA